MCIRDRVEELELLEPFGKGNTKPVFVEKDMLVLNSRILGKNQNVLKMQVKDLGGTVMDAIYFGEAQECLEKIRRAGGKITATYYPCLLYTSTEKAKRKIQLKL